MIIAAIVDSWTFMIDNPNYTFFKFIIPPFVDNLGVLKWTWAKMGQILYTKVIWGHIKSRSYMKHPLYCDEKNIRKIYPVTTPQNQLKD